MPSEDALISRTILMIDRNRVCITEKWDLKHPNLPFVISPYHNIGLHSNAETYSDQKNMPLDEFNRLANQFLPKP